MDLFFLATRPCSRIKNNYEKNLLLLTLVRLESVVLLGLVMSFLGDVEFLLLQNLGISLLVEVRSHSFVVVGAGLLAINNVFLIELRIFQMLGEHLLVDFRLRLLLCLLDDSLDTEAVIGVLLAEIVLEVRDLRLGTLTF